MHRRWPMLNSKTPANLLTGATPGHWPKPGRVAQSRRQWAKEGPFPLHVDRRRQKTSHCHKSNIAVVEPPCHFCLGSGWPAGDQTKSRKQRPCNWGQIEGEENWIELSSEDILAAPDSRLILAPAGVQLAIVGKPLNIFSPAAWTVIPL